MTSRSEDRFRWTWNGTELATAYARRGEGPSALLLPALSSISTHGEMAPLQRRLQDRFETIAADWPGFGTADKPAIAWSSKALADWLDRLLAQHVPAPALIVVAGHGAGYVLRHFAASGGEVPQLILIAPTWRGPLPTMTGRPSSAFSTIATAGDRRLLGAALYRMNVNRPVMAMMARGHVYSDRDWLTGDRLAEKMAVIDAAGARHGSIRFVTGQLDPFADRESFLNAAEEVAAKTAILVIHGEEAPRKSRAEIDRLAGLPGIRRTILPRGKLSVHEEFPDEVARAIGDFLPG